VLHMGMYIRILPNFEVFWNGRSYDAVRCIYILLMKERPLVLTRFPPSVFFKLVIREVSLALVLSIYRRC
jgi:hypothetical protein